jgi:hypothetical protein
MRLPKPAPFTVVLSGGDAPRPQCPERSPSGMTHAESFLDVPLQCIAASLIVKHAQCWFKDFRESGLKMRSNRRILCTGRSQAIRRLDRSWPAGCRLQPASAFVDECAAVRFPPPHFCTGSLPIESYRQSSAIATRLIVSRPQAGGRTRHRVFPSQRGTLLLNCR